jgi:Putative Flp pilus-assembly TadE/G-like
MAREPFDEEVSAMRTNRRNWNWKRRTDRAGEAGQTTVFFVLVLGIFLLGALCLAFDFSNMWFHRQAAQTASDAACAAGAMDILVDAQGGATGHQGFTLGTAFDCSSTGKPLSSVCQYAAKNGYNSTAPGNLVSVSFPTTAANGAPPGVSIPPASSAGAFPFIRVDVVDHVQTFFLGLLNGSTRKDVRAFSTCGVELAAAPIPLLVLHPTNAGALTVQGNSSSNACDNSIKNKLCIWGGPQQSIQVDSSDPGATSIGGSAVIDLKKGGPTNTGSDLGTWGGPTTVPGNFQTGSTGNWLAPNPPINDPFASLAVPTGTNAPAPTVMAGPTTSPIVCPDTQCVRYSAGKYPTGLCVGNGPSPCICPISAHCTAIFDPGVYIIEGNFSVVANSCLRPSGAPGDGTGGIMFYFTGGSSVSVGADSGNKCQTNFNTAGYPGTSSLLNGIKCKSSSTIPSNLAGVATLSGNVLLAPCSGTYGDPFEALTPSQTDPDGEQHGFLMFQDRTTASANQNWGGGGSMLLAGTMYFHNKNNFSDAFTLNGNSGSSTYVLGDIVADNVTLKGDSQVTMDLNTSVVFNVLKASIFQ